jgi:hypothetical protein
MKMAKHAYDWPWSRPRPIEDVNVGTIMEDFQDWLMPYLREHPGVLGPDEDVIDRYGASALIAIFDACTDLALGKVTPAPTPRPAHAAD